ncbi:SUF system NifU family Fe-S cluster assembly protein [bacterium CPR1]|nr:SUF system NifU family Fe-S cluster assembly protein [bacterium CPR1]
MISDDLYREIILEHYAHPRCKGKLEAPTFRQDGVNPTCGDAVTVELDVKDNRVVRAAFEGVGCSISLASASMLTSLIEGKTLDEVRELAATFKKRMLNRNDAEPCPEQLGELEALDGVRQYPVRVKCALLAWNTLLGALEEAL